jgi:predicted kinase
MSWIKVDGANLFLSREESPTNKIAFIELYNVIYAPKNGEESLLPNLENSVFLGEENIKMTLLELQKKKFTIVFVGKSKEYQIAQQIQKTLLKKFEEQPFFILRNDRNKFLNFASIVLSVKSYEKESFYCRMSSFKLFGINNFTAYDIFGNYEVTPKKEQELIVLTGMPASGKSTVSFQLRKKHKYFTCDTDTMPNFERKETIECVRRNLVKGKSVIAIALNASINTRAEFLSIAKELNVPARIIWFPRDGRYMNSLRGKQKVPATTFIHQKPVPFGVFKRYTAMFDEPTEKEAPVEIAY